jgi:2-(1,2-epoxy-1,2-dihydrophenyl)acetyl-CoA isomerase
MVDQYETLTFAKVDGVARLTLNRPKVMNALSRQAMAEIISVLDDVRDQGDTRVLLITGEGRGFCSGADLSQAGAGAGTATYDAGEILEALGNPMMERLFALPVPVISAVRGAVAGMGCMLALAADIVIAAQSAYFLQAFVKVGLVPDAGSFWLLPRLVGRARAQAMMMLGERISAQTALEWGMIYQVVEDDALDAHAGAIAAKLAAGPTRTYALIRQGLRAALEQPLSQVLVQERHSQLLAGRTEDYREGVTAFREKRQAQFKGR